MRQLVSSGSTFEKEIGFSRAVVDGDWILNLEPPDSTIRL